MFVDVFSRHILAVNLATTTLFSPRPRHFSRRRQADRGEARGRSESLSRLILDSNVAPNRSRPYSDEAVETDLVCFWTVKPGAVVSRKGLKHQGLENKSLVRYLG